MALKNDDIIQITFRGLCFGQRIIMTRPYLVSGDFPVGTTFATDLDSICTAVAAGGVQDIMTPYLACLPAVYSLSEIRAQRVWPTRIAYRSIGFGGAVGTNAGAATVANDSACITLRTAFAGRKQVANMHIGPVPDTVSVAGLITAAYKVTLNVLGPKLVTSFVPVGSGSLLVPVIFHRATHDNDLVQQFILGDQSRVQRRRTVGVGE